MPRVKESPVIARRLQKADHPTRVPTYGSKPEKILEEHHNDVSSIRGLGDSGTKVQSVFHRCPECNNDEMIRKISVKPETYDSVEYWCLDPACNHFVSDSLSTYL